MYREWWPEGSDGRFGHKIRAHWRAHKNMRYVYVLSIRDDNTFIVMTIISATVLRKNDPDAEIMVVVDENTDLEQFPEELALLNRIMLSIHVIVTGYIDSVLSSRFIKLSLPNVVNDSFWYLDSDTLPLVSLNVPDIECDIGLVRDLNMAEHSYGLGSSRVLDCELMNWPIPKYPYYNSGVIFVNVNRSVIDLFGQAKTLWLAAVENEIRCGDQLPLNIAIQRASDIRVQLLDDSYNAQIRVAPKLASTAKIIHIFSGSLAKHNDTVLHALIGGWRDERVLKYDIIDRLMKTRNPWLRGTKQSRLFPIRKLLSLFRAPF